MAFVLKHDRVGRSTAKAADSESLHEKDTSRVHIVRLKRLDYQASAEQAESVARALAQRFPEITVTVDDNLRDDLPAPPLRTTVGLIALPDPHRPSSKSERSLTSSIRPVRTRPTSGRSVLPGFSSGTIIDDAREASPERARLVPPGSV
ncbi:hypothetical protein [Nocardia abscessus]|uniref:hypothetical protein n=1 Tax=Nocardia abscessus TaxID=120957 RepID=UPI00245466CA|nr:hypothetical protein [Nocardia abscessus]